MTPPTFRTGDNVEIIGPAEYGNTDHIGEKFKIETYHKEGPGFGGRDLYSACGLRWYPASSLRLVEAKPLSPMHVTYNYKPDDCEHGTFQISCPCGRKAEIDPSWAKLDEWRQVMNLTESGLTSLEMAIVAERLRRLGDKA